MNNILQNIAIYTNPRILTVIFLGFASGLPFPLTFVTLSMWFAEEGVSKADIGLFALVGTPFVIKFMWAPLLDGISIPILGQVLGKRRSWIIFSQIAIIIALIILGSGDPTGEGIFGGLLFMASMALIVSIFSATQDIAIDAYRIEILDDNQQGAGAAAIVFGWRVGALVSGAGALFAASAYGWFVSYIIMALLMFVGIIATLISKPTDSLSDEETPKTIKDFLKNSVIEPFREFASRDSWLFILIFIILYKVGDSIALSMLSPFAVELGFSKNEFASIVKIYGTIATMLGAFAGGMVMYRYGMIKGLLICGFLQMISTLSFIWMSYMGHDLMALTVTISLENFASGMGTAAFVGYLSHLCNKKFTATQYALFSSLAATGRTWFSSLSGYMVGYLGWPIFFAVCIVIAIPALVMLIKLGKLEEGNKNENRVTT